MLCYAEMGSGMKRIRRCTLSTFRTSDSLLLQSSLSNKYASSTVIQSVAEYCSEWIILTSVIVASLEPTSQETCWSRAKHHEMPLIDPVTMSSPGTSQAAPVKASLPIELLPTDLARIVSQAHPALLLSAFYLRFPALVANPTSTLLSSLLPLALAQTAYAVLCLPAVGSTTKPVKKTKLNASKRTAEPATAKAFVSMP